MKVLVTGVTGLIGKHLAELLLEKGGFEIRGQYFSPRDISDYERKGIEMVRADICQKESLTDICKGSDVVVHSAARVIDFGSKQDFYESHYDATSYMLDDALKHGVQHFVYVSSFGPATYIDRSKGLPDETVPLVKSGIHYDDAKIDTETLVKTFCNQHGIRFSIVRPGAVIGPDSVWVKEPLLRAQKNPGVFLINGGVTDACLIDARNLALGIWLIITKPVSNGQTYFFMDEYGVNWKDYLTTLLAMTGRKPGRSLPKGLMLGIAHFLNTILPPLNIKPPISPKSIMALGSDRRVIVSKARKELGWVSEYDYQNSIENIRRWVKANESWLK